MSQLFSQHVSRVVCFGLKGFVTWQIVEQFVCQATSVGISSPGYSRFSDVSRGVVGFYRRITRVKSHKSLQPWRIFNEISWVLGISNIFVLQPLNQCNRGSRNLDMCSSNKWQSWKELNWKKHFAPLALEGKLSLRHDLQYLWCLFSVASPWQVRSLGSLNVAMKS